LPKQTSQKTITNRCYFGSDSDNSSGPSKTSLGLEIYIDQAARLFTTEPSGTAEPLLGERINDKLLTLAFA
jgi:hypothetical protein